MNIIEAPLSQQQATIVKDIAQKQIQTLLRVSSNQELCVNIPLEEKESVIRRLLRDFSFLVQFPHQLFNMHSHSQSIFRHELFTVSYGGQDARDEYPIDNYPSDDLKALWRKVIAAQEFKHTQLN